MSVQLSMKYFMGPRPVQTKFNLFSRQICLEVLDEIIKSVVPAQAAEVGQHVIFHEDWCKVYPWLTYDDRNQKMFCMTCKDFGGTNMKSTFANSGASNFQMSTLRKHNLSQEHQLSSKARRHYEMKMNVENDDDGDKDLPQPSQEQLVLFSTVLHAAQEYFPNNKINGLLRLQRFNGASITFQDLSDDSVQDIRKSLVHVIHENLKTKIANTKVLGIIVDESTYVSVHKKLVIYCRLVSASGDIETLLLGNVRVMDGTAETLETEIIKKCEEFGINMSQVVGLGSDGASVMMGSKAGVGVRLKKQHCPYLVHVHCLAHRLALACSQAANDFEYFKRLRTNINTLYHHFDSSSVRQSKLEEIQSVLNEVQLKLKEPTSVRWLSLENAVNAIFRCYQSVVVTLSDDAMRNNNPKAKGLHDFLTTYKFCKTLALLCDVLKILGTLSKKFQFRDLLYASVKPAIEAAIGGLSSLKTDSGPCLEDLDSRLSIIKDDFGNINHAIINQAADGNNSIKVKCSPHQISEFNSLREKYISKVIENLKVRLYPTTETESLLQALGTFTDPQSFNVMKKEEIKDCYGTVCQYFMGLIDANALRKELAYVGGLLHGCYQNYTSDQFLKIFIRRHLHEYPNFGVLCQTALCIPLTSVECERGFSLQNKIKTKSRGRLTPEHLDDLLKLLSGPGLESFNYKQAIHHWHAVKKRRLAALFKPGVNKKRKCEDVEDRSVTSTQFILFSSDEETESQ